MGSVYSGINGVRRVAIPALPVVTGVSGVLGYLFPATQAFDWVFKIALSGTVGLWTNHFAIRMLFKPHKKTAFGRQGLIPAKRADLARAIGEAVAQRLLDTDSVLAYLDQNNTLEKGAHLAVDWIHKLSTRQSFRAATAGYIQKLLENMVEQHSESLILRIQEFLTELIHEKTAAGKIWPAFREGVQRELENPDTREGVVRAVINLADRHDTEIAAFVNSSLDDYIGSRKMVEKLILGIGKKVLRVNEEMIRREIRRRVRSPRFFDDILAFLDENTPEIQEWLDSPGVRSWFQKKLDELRSRVSDWLRNEGVDLGVKKVRSMLLSDDLWNWVSSQIDVQVDSLAAMARERILSPGFRRTAREFARKAASEIDVQGIVQGKVDQLDLDELEELVLNVSGENLAAIELFGALLGGFAGLILIDIRFLPLLPVLAVVFIAAEKAFTRVAGKR